MHRETDSLRPVQLVEQMTEREHPGSHALEHRYAVASQQRGRVLVETAWQVADDGERLVGAPCRVKDGERVGVVAVKLGDQVAGKGDQALAEQLTGACAGTPYVERVGRQQTGIEQIGQRRLGRFADGSER